MHRFQNFCAAIAVILASSSYCQRSLSLEFYVRYHAFIVNENQFYIVTLGDGRERNSILTVFEMVGSDFKIRRLHQTELFNRCEPLYHLLCGAGRFFVATDDQFFGDSREVKDLLAIYDLVRNEKTSYSLRDIFSEEQIKSLDTATEPPDDIISRNEWKQYFGYVEQHFDPTTLEFRIPLPIIRGRDYSEILVNLPSRSVSVVRSDSPIDIKQGIMAIDKKQNNPTGMARVIIATSQESNEERILVEKGNAPPTLPRLLKFSDTKTNEELVYELDPNRMEYERVDNSKWNVLGSINSGCSRPASEATLPR